MKVVQYYEYHWNVHLKSSNLTHQFHFTYKMLSTNAQVFHNSMSFSKHVIHKTNTSEYSVAIKHGSSFTLVTKATTAAFSTHSWVSLQISINCMYYELHVWLLSMLWVTGRYAVFINYCKSSIVIILCSHKSHVQAAMALPTPTGHSYLSIFTVPVTSLWAWL